MTDSVVRQGRGKISISPEELSRPSATETNDKAVKYRVATAGIPHCLGEAENPPEQAGQI